MKNLFSTLAVSIIFGFVLVGQASATGGTCMFGCEGGGPQGGGASGFDVTSFGGFKTFMGSDAAADGTGDTVWSETFAKTEEASTFTANITGTTFGPGSPCDATCAENKAELSFSGLMQTNSGAINASTSETGPASSWAVTESRGHFGVGMGTNWTAPVQDPAY
jgi:hypothetical protein